MVANALLAQSYQYQAFCSRERFSGSEVGDAGGYQSWSIPPAPRRPLISSDEHVLEYVGAIGHQAVDTTVQQLDHLDGIVDGP